MDSAPLGTGHVGNPKLCLGCQSGKDGVVGASRALPLPSLVSVAVYLASEIAPVSS